MGCDIHLHIEVLIDGKWEHYSAPCIWRDYPLFTKMAGVRDYDGSIAPISLPKGMPDNASLITVLEYKRIDSDGHSHSWLSLKEIGELIAWFDTMNSTTRKSF